MRAPAVEAAVFGSGRLSSLSRKAVVVAQHTKHTKQPSCSAGFQLFQFI